MAYHPDNNPLKGVRVEQPQFCERRDHLMELLMHGLCSSCLQTIPLPNDDTPVFQRLENIKKIGV